MQTKRDYLVGLGLAKPGRGKFSNAAKEALAKAEAEGMKFSDAAPKATGPVKTDEPTTKVTAPAGESAYIVPSDFRFPIGEYVAVARDEDGKRVIHSLRECCNTCRVSLTNHFCDSPTILGLIPVKIEPVK